MMQKYVKKPIAITALQFDGSNYSEISNFLDCNHVLVPREGNVIIKTLEGDMTAIPGDYIIRGVKGEFYPCKEDIFLETYDKLEDK
jgi:homogentisate 1,2-dioxygenase